MDKVMEISLPTKTLQQFNLCRLHKRTYFLTDIMDSKQKGLHPMIIHPDYQKDTFEKFPNIELPKRYWKEWEQIIKTIHASSRVSGFHAGLATHSNCIMWLQSKDRNKLLHQIKPKTYRVYKLLEASRNKYVYTKALYHETDIYDTIGYFKVSVNNKDRTIETDGYDCNLIPSPKNIEYSFPIFHLAQRFQGWLQRQLTTGTSSMTKTSWDVLISETVR